MLYVDPEIAALLRDDVNLGVFFRLDTVPALHLWLGVHDVKIGQPGKDIDGTVYLGAGRIIDVPELEILINGLAEEVTFSFSMASEIFDRFLPTIDEEAPDVRGAPVMVGIAPFDKYYQALSAIIPLWSGTADYWSLSRKPNEDPKKSPVVSISLSVSVGDTSRATPKQLTFTSAVQRSFFPSDGFCDRVSRYLQNYVVSWPRY